MIIGASSGLGQRIAMDFARAGWRVGIAARREAPLQAIKEEFPGNVAYSVIDVTQVDAPKKFLDLIEMIDGMDILLYTAGTGFCDPELDDTRLDNTLQTNVVGFARIIAAAYKYYRDTASARPGQIAAITSVAGTKGIGISAAYSSSKDFSRCFSILWTSLRTSSMSMYASPTSAPDLSAHRFSTRTSLIPCS